MPSRDSSERHAGMNSWGLAAWSRPKKIFKWANAGAISACSVAIARFNSSKTSGYWNNISLHSFFIRSIRAASFPSLICEGNEKICGANAENYQLIRRISVKNRCFKNVYCTGDSGRRAYDCVLDMFLLRAGQRPVFRQGTELHDLRKDIFCCGHVDDLGILPLCWLPFKKEYERNSGEL